MMDRESMALVDRWITARSRENSGRPHIDNEIDYRSGETFDSWKRRILA